MFFQTISKRSIIQFTFWFWLASHIAAAAAIYYFVFILGPENAYGQFKVTPHEVKEYKTQQAYRKKLSFEKPMKDDVWSASYPIMYVKSLSKGVIGEIGVYGISGKVKYMSNQLTNEKNNKDDYNEPIFLQFHRADTAQFQISMKNRMSEFVLDIKNFVELGQEFYVCATFEIRTISAIYNVEITYVCMFTKSLLHRWSTTSRRFGSEFPKNIPLKATGSTKFGIYFQREQPCHFAAVFIANVGHEILLSIPLKNVTLQTTSDGYHIIIGEQGDGTIYKSNKNEYMYMIDETMKHYQETNRIYELKSYIPVVNNSIIFNSFRDFKIDNDMWLSGSTFKYDVTEKLCYIIQMNSRFLLNKNNTQIFGDGTNIKILVTMDFDAEITVLFLVEQYGTLIENDAKKCGIY